MFFNALFAYLLSHLKVTSVIKNRHVEEEDGEEGAQMPFQHALSAVSGEDLLAGNAGKLVRLCHKPAGRDLGGWQAFRRVAVDIWCRE